MKEQGRQYQVTAILSKGGSMVKQFKSKKKGIAWAKEQKGYVAHRVETVK